MSSALRRPLGAEYLVGHWPLNSHADDVVRGNNGTWAGTEAYADGPFNWRSVADFNNASRIDASGSFDLTSAFSVFAWIRPDTLANYDVIVYSNVVNQFNLYLTNTGAITSYGSAGASGPSVMSAGERAHAGATWDGTSLTVYKNGNPGTPVATSQGGTGSTSLDIGAFAATNNFDGLIWDVRLYNVALTGDEAVALYRYSKTR